MSIAKGKIKTAYLNHLRAVMRIIRVTLKDRGLISMKQPPKHAKMIGLFSKIHNIQLPGKRHHKLFLINLYLEGHPAFPQDDHFYQSSRWLNLRAAVLERYGSTCMKCGTPTHSPHIDHIKPRSKYPALEYDLDNLQVFCMKCNIGKGNRSTQDYRPNLGDISDLL